MENSQEILAKALQLKPIEKCFIIDGLLQSLDEPNKELDQIWAVEAENRLNAYRQGKLKGIPMEALFDDERQ